MPECRSWARAVNAKKRARAKCREAQTLSSNVCTAHETNETPVIENKSTGAILKNYWMEDGSRLPRSRAVNPLCHGRIEKPLTPPPLPQGERGDEAGSNLISSRRSETVLPSLACDSLCSREDVIALAFARAWLSPLGS